MLSTVLEVTIGTLENIYCLKIIIINLLDANIAKFVKSIFPKTEIIKEKSGIALHFLQTSCLAQ